jgi:thymidylate synthase (FAD)
MKIIDPSYEIISPIDRPYIMKHLEAIGRTCYKSEDKITDESAGPFIRGIIKSGHEAMIEHFSFSVRFVVNRAFTHEIVRHRIASFAQESQRYVNYGKEKHGSEITFIRPTYHDNKKLMKHWTKGMTQAEKIYFLMLKDGARPQDARDVLPNSTKTEIVVTCNLREWRTIFSLRADKPAAPVMREIMVPFLKDMKDRLPDIFFDLEFEL